MSLYNSELIINLLISWQKVIQIKLNFKFHFLDFISWWTDESISHFDNSNLDEKWHLAKREGFWEINGCLVVYFSNGSTGTFYSDNENNSPFELRIQTISENWIIGWDTGVAKRDDGLEINGRVLFQSEMTSDLVKEILEI